MSGAAKGMAGLIAALAIPGALTFGFTMPPHCDGPWLLNSAMSSTMSVAPTEKAVA